MFSPSFYDSNFFNFTLQSKHKSSFLLNSKHLFFNKVALGAFRYYSVFLLIFWFKCYFQKKKFLSSIKINNIFLPPLWTAETCFRLVISMVNFEGKKINFKKKVNCLITCFTQTNSLKNISSCC